MLWWNNNISTRCQQMKASRFFRWGIHRHVEADIVSTGCRRAQLNKSDLKNWEIGNIQRVWNNLDCVYPEEE